MDLMTHRDISLRNKDDVALPLVLHRRVRYGQPHLRGPGGSGPLRLYLLLLATSPLSFSTPLSIMRLVPCLLRLWTPPFRQSILWKRAENLACEP